MLKYRWKYFAHVTSKGENSEKEEASRESTRSVAVGPARRRSGWLGCWPDSAEGNVVLVFVDCRQVKPVRTCCASDLDGAGDGDRTRDIQLGKLAFYR